MSFGFSVGDFVTVGKLIADIVSSLRTSSISEYRELILELHGLQRALHSIEHLKCSASQEAEVNGIKVAALMCQYSLDEFAGKLKRFERLGSDAGIKFSKLQLMCLWGRKLQWGFCMKEEVEKLRVYIAAHVGSLNMRLITQGLISTSFAIDQADHGRTALEGRIEDAYRVLCQTQRGLHLQFSIIRNTESILQKLSNLIMRGIASQIKTLIDLATNIWESNLQVMDSLAKMQTSYMRPELRFTWVQEPVRFEDALGRILPVPSEYNSRKLEAIMLDQFRDGLGHQKVSAGEYELFNSLDSSQTVTLSEDECLTPGMAITMAIVVGQYASIFWHRCPRPDCRSSRVARHEAGGLTCLICKAWFDVARKILPKPFRPPMYGYCETAIGFRGSKRKKDEMDDVEPMNTQEVHARLRMQRNKFKNIRLHQTAMPARHRKGLRREPRSNVISKASQIRRTDYRMRCESEAPAIPVLKWSPVPTGFFSAPARPTYLELVDLRQ